MRQELLPPIPLLNNVVCVHLNQVPLDRGKHYVRISYRSFEVLNCALFGLNALRPDKYLVDAIEPVLVLSKLKISHSPIRTVAQEKLIIA